MGQKQPKKSLLTEIPQDLPSSPQKEKKSREERMANRLVRLAKRLPSPHSDTLLRIAEGVAKGAIQLLSAVKEYKVGDVIDTPFGQGQVVGIIPVPEKGRTYLKVKVGQETLLMKGHKIPKKEGQK